MREKELKKKEMREKVMQEKDEENEEVLPKEERKVSCSNPLFISDDFLLKGLEEIFPNKECKVLCSNSLFTSDDSLLKGLEEELPREEGIAPNEVLNLCKTQVPQVLEVPTLNTCKD